MRNDTREDGSRFAVWESGDPPLFRHAATEAEFMAQVEDDEDLARPARLAAKHLRQMLAAEAARVTAEEAEFIRAQEAALPKT